MSESTVSEAVWGSGEAEACWQLVRLALQEDLGETGDLTSQALIPGVLEGHAVFVARASGVVAGLLAVRTVYEAVEPLLRLETLTDDGQRVEAGRPLAAVQGKMQSILAGERTALNFLQRLSGVASLTKKYVQAITGLPCQILDTRKTTPGWRRLEKYAVRCGGGHNHRMGLYDGVLIKDNHLASIGGTSDSIPKAVDAARLIAGTDKVIEIEVDTLEQLEKALACRPDRILLDNMDVATLGEAVQMRAKVDPRIPLEASGGITLANVRAVAETGVDFISIGALTHSAPALDIGLDYQT